MPPSAVVTTDLSELRQEIFKNDEAKRIVVKVRTESQDTEEHRASAYRAASEVFPDWERDGRVLFLAIEAWGERTFMAIDVNNHDYDFATAHKNKTVLPVYVLRQSRKRKIWALIRWPREDEPLATNLEDLHNVSGWDAATPFLENHNTSIVHANPRELRVTATANCGQQTLFPTCRHGVDDPERGVLRSHLCEKNFE